MEVLVGLIIGNVILLILSLNLEKIFPIFKRLEEQAEKYKKSTVTFKTHKNSMKQINDFRDTGNKIIIFAYLQPLMKGYRANITSKIAYTLLIYFLIGVYEVIQYMDEGESIFTDQIANIPVLAFLFYFLTLFIVVYELRKILILKNI